MDTKEKTIEEAFSKIVEKTEELERDEKIDPLETLKNDPVFIWGSRDDDVYYPIMQRLLEKFYNQYSGVVKYEEGEVGHWFQDSTPGDAL